MRVPYREMSAIVEWRPGVGVGVVIVESRWACEHGHVGKLGVVLEKHGVLFDVRTMGGLRAPILRCHRDELAPIEQALGVR